MYTDLAHLWRLVSDPADYAEEARHWRDALRTRLGPGRHEILELGVGGGNNLSHLTADFAATAVDLSPAMVEQARELNPEVGFHVGDMRTVRLGHTFAAVIIHDAISYMLTKDDLRAAFRTAAVHLERGGVFITAPDWYRETFRDPATSTRTNSDGCTTLTTFEYNYDPDPGDTTVEYRIWYVIREGGSLRVEQDHHTLGLFPKQTWLDLMAEAGFEVEAVPYGVHDDQRDAWLLVGTKE